MTKKTEAKDKVVKVGVTRAGVLLDKEVSVIRKRCQLGILGRGIVARQDYPGADWDIYIPYEVYLNLLAARKITHN